MKNKSTLLLAALFVITVNIYAQNYSIRWENINKAPGKAFMILPVNDNTFYALRTSGSPLRGYTYSSTRHDNLSLAASGKLEMYVEGSRTRYENAICFNDKLFLFLAERKDGKINIYMQEYDKNIKLIGKTQKLASFVNNDKGRFGDYVRVVKSKNNEFMAVIWEIPGKKKQEDNYSYKIFNNEFKEIAKGEYKTPFEGRYSESHEHYLTNTGQYFVSILEFKVEEKILFTTYLTVKAAHIYQITQDTMKDFALSLQEKRITTMRMNIENDNLVTITGIYCDEGKSGIDGIFYARYDLDKQEVIDEKYKKFDKDLITQGWTDKEKAKADKDESKGKGEAKLYNYKMGDSEYLQDGSIVGSIEQYYRIIVITTDANTGGKISNYHDYYNDIITYHLDANGDFKWMKKIPKEQFSINDYGYYSSYAQFLNGDKICYIFNDDVNNYTEAGEYIETEHHKAKFSQKKNVVALVEIDINDGKLKRSVFFDKNVDKSIAVPKKFLVNHESGELVLYTINGKKERFGVMSLNGKK